ncbi:hypothetical protein GCM10027277_42580 [Pseudoduganella ginsengisoli]|uniref:MipA/OmpV family protein n=1 Tax=Pseudoduganella ginsengisoli TaxID=1462440 RepID=A0A6L6Q7D7_9BURK|nr:MipA/OmpV family protein [Pseudoduganella ginsengisoli]MTW05138.1 hypothetical protein [Pseudoduganella ginsengisoli]
MKPAVACTAFLLASPVCAQAEASLLPEGSVDVAVAAVAGIVPAAPGSAARKAFLLPQFYAEWSNGMFIDGFAAGIQLSRDPQWKFGPMVALDLGAQRTDGSHRGMRPVFGAFADYMPMRELNLHAHAVAPAGRDGNGMLVNLRAGTPVLQGAHAVLAIGLGANLADAGYTQSVFGTARYQASGGVRDVFADAHWTWQMSRKTTLKASLQSSVLQGDAAASPRTAQRTGTAALVALRYGF